MPKPISQSFAIENNLEALAKTLEAIGEFLEAHSISNDKRYSALLAIEELSTNTITYGYRDKEKHTIDVSLLLKKDRLLIRLEDDGIAFDPRQESNPKLDTPLEERPIGGLGIFLTKKHVETFNYQRLENINKIELFIRL